MSTLGVKKHVKYGVYDMYQKSVCIFFRITNALFVCREMYV